MPFTPYHFGPSGFVGLVFRKWIDVPVFVLANVVIDIEVLFAPGWPQHRHWHWHTLLIGAVVGALWGTVAYPMRHLFREIMRGFRIRYETGLCKMIWSGALGATFHVIVDSFYHYDVQPFWPKARNPFWRLLTQEQIELICLAFFVAAAVTYFLAVRSFIESRKNQTSSSLKEREGLK